MRQALADKVGETITVTAKIARSGVSGRRDYGEGVDSNTYLLENVCDADSQALLCEHLWVEVADWARGVRIGDTIKITGVVSRYAKAYDRFSGRYTRIDFGLQNLSLVEFVEFSRQSRMLPDGSIKP